MNAIACGVSTSGPWLSPLCDAATVICLLDDALRGAIPDKYRGKIVSFHVGPDRWVNPYHTELAGILDAMMDRNAATLSHITGTMKGGAA